jgi:serpin B
MANTSRFGYYEDKQVQVVELPYVDKAKSMFVVLPKPDFSFQSFEKALSVAQMEKWTEVGERKVEVFLPSFTIDTQVNLEQILMKMGMPLPFSNKADFSGMTGDTDLKIDKVIHQAFVDVSEAGTEAAAATAVVMVRKTSVDVEEKVTFNANRPFFFIIRDNASGVILFAGRLMNPA